ncbi:hypothetical protein ACFYYR_14460 [Streptomyces sp. NPDC001922]|uniref:hypothetical protein n=1 Tax=Streptomyces sp. NPDC001922 TaxID=3364624 RepID=UPI0036881FA1
MNAAASGDTSGVWLARTVWSLLEEKYGRGNVPSVRKLTQCIREANGGATISHGHVHNILNGDATNITDKTRDMLAGFFGLPPSYFVPVTAAPCDGGGRLDEALAYRFALLRPEELEAIERALRLVRERAAEGAAPTAAAAPHPSRGEA